MIQVKQLSVEQLKSKFDKNEVFILVDVREPDEYETCHIEGSKLMPISKFAQEGIKQLKPDDDIVVHCHHGGRSQRACDFLVSQGFKNVANLAGGIEAWSIKIDPKVPRY